jgi:hypothetical protein
MIIKLFQLEADVARQFLKKLLAHQEVSPAPCLMKAGLKSRKPSPHQMGRSFQGDRISATC